MTIQTTLVKNAINYLLSFPSCGQLPVFGNTTSGHIACVPEVSAGKKMEPKAPPYGLNNGSFLPKSNFHAQNLNFRCKGQRSSLRSMNFIEKSWVSTRRTIFLKSATVKSPPFPSYGRFFIFMQNITSLFGS